MLFNSIDFALFLPTVFLLYWFVFKNNLKAKNLLLLVASYVFYGWWDWRFLSLIVISTLIDYFVGLNLQKEENQKRRFILLWISIIFNLGFLGFFKYFNFFLDNFITAFSFFGFNFHVNALSIVLPVGISFYTFQTLSYTIDVYKKKLEPTKDIIAFGTFVSFFPQLVAGPIERASNLLPQFYSLREFNYEKATDGCRQILWGLFKKVVIADNCATISNLIFNNHNDYGGVTYFVGGVFFAFQIYGDFSGYSDIAIGTSRLFGFNLQRNFNFPYFSRDIAEFWRRWHISLSTWFRDYLYIPLGGSRVSTSVKIRNTFIIFVVSGFWHGANWTFIVWGALNALYFLPLLVTNQNRSNLEVVALGKLIPSFKDGFKILMTFSLTVLAWIFFRADSINIAFSMVIGIFDELLIRANFIDTILILRYDFGISMLVILVLFVFIEWIGREGEFAIDRLLMNKGILIRWTFYYLIIFILFNYSGVKQEFIYFQF